jgi:hypothetical protein
VALALAWRQEWCVGEERERREMKEIKDRKNPTGRNTNSHVELDQRMIGGQLEDVFRREK